MDKDTVEIKRSIYTIWDFFGDLGGFNDFMQILGAILMSISTIFKGSGLDRFLVEQLFYQEKKSSSGKIRREPARFTLSFCCC